ncbi:MAG: bifunctional 3-phenylpropionate/cinnamic acid dioxygenase ferredoxin subunit [Microbacteriaceae bacterium]|nr:bifunctional 3-phenylpropionate/cinnamic acid dioxygenase ferredoxin subunit [Microbacteriaceae bacterium]
MAAINLGRLERIPEGEAIVVDAAEAGTAGDIAVFHAEDGAFYALDDTCSHETASLADGWIEGAEVECPIHSAKFCLKTGAALCMPATVPVATHRIEVVGDELVLHPGEAAQ